MKWFRVDFNDVFLNGLTSSQIGCVVKYKCMCQQLEVDELNEKQLKSIFSSRELKFVRSYFKLCSKNNEVCTENAEVCQEFVQSKSKVCSKKENKNNDLAIYNNINNNINNTEETDKTDKKEDSDKSPSKKYAFEGKIIRLTQVDFDKWKKAYPDLNLYAELLQRDDYLATQPPDEQKRWYLSTSAFFIKQNERRKAQNNSNNNEDTFGDYL